jgi:hypothetical protein
VPRAAKETARKLRPPNVLLKTPNRHNRRRGHAIRYASSHDGLQHRFLSVSSSAEYYRARSWPHRAKRESGTKLSGRHFTGRAFAVTSFRASAAAPLRWGTGSRRRIAMETRWCTDAFDHIRRLMRGSNASSSINERNVSLRSVQASESALMVQSSRKPRTRAWHFAAYHPPHHTPRR